jgi:hypothetical protein
MLGRLWGVILLRWHYFVCLPMVVILPVSVLADDTAAAMLRSNGTGVLVNKNAAPSSTALFPNDLIETQKDSVARIETSGSTAEIGAETMVQFDGDELVLDHGTVSVNTSRGLRVRVGCLTIRPVNNTEWTHYDVADVDGKVTVSALKNDASIDSQSGAAQQTKQSVRSNRVIVHEGEQKSREEKCGGADMRKTGTIAGKGGILNSPLAKGAGLAITGALTCLGLCHGDDPISPSGP